MFAANGHVATRLTRKNKEICSILSQEWEHLPNADSVVLSSLILKFYDGGIRSSHRVLRHANELQEFGPNYQLNEREFNKTLDLIGKTTATRKDGELEIRAVTLMGWMHDKRNLGIEHITINPSGVVTMKQRMVLSKRFCLQDYRPGSVITDVIRLKGSACEPLRSTKHAWDHKEAYRSQPMAFDASSIGSRCSDCSLVRN